MWNIRKYAVLLLLQAGGRIEAGASKSQTLYGTAFGNP